jgi:hypothetical protein
MRSPILLSLVALAGCASVPPPTAPQPAGTEEPIPVHGSTPGKVCNESAAQSFVGQPATDETGTAILRATNAAVLRWARPGTMMTMDVREDRATVRVGADNRITQVSCG